MLKLSPLNQSRSLWDIRQNLLLIVIATVVAGCASEASKPVTQQVLGAQKSEPITPAVPKVAPVKCGDSASQTSMNECFASEAKRDMQLLDALLKELGQNLDASERERLEEVQSQWAKYRDAHCKWQAAFFEGGSVQPMMYSTCISAVTWNRIDELKLNLCEGAGMTGPCEASKRYDRSSQ
jgi:uncharacterized protein YecT (DUF1311 family)